MISVEVWQETANIVEMLPKLTEESHHKQYYEESAKEWKC